MTTEQADAIKQWTVICPKHGDVTSIAMDFKIHDGERSFSRGYCLECVGEAFDKLGIPQVKGEWK